MVTVVELRRLDNGKGVEIQGNQAQTLAPDMLNCIQYALRTFAG
jgi:hypothetical protein